MPSLSSALREAIISIMMINMQENLSSILGKAEMSGSQPKDPDVSKARKRCCSVYIKQLLMGELVFVAVRLDLLISHFSHLSPLVLSKGGKKTNSRF